MSKTKNYIPKQMNGPIIGSYADALDVQFYDAEVIQKYLHDLTIDNAQETELENIGRIIGYPRPLVPEGFEFENLLLLGSLPLEQDAQSGLSSVGSEIGGILSSSKISTTNYMALGTYRKILKKIAELKRYGMTLKAIDDIVSLVSTDYTLSWETNGDIRVTFNQGIGYKNTWILTQIFYRVALDPQILIYSGV